MKINIELEFELTDVWVDATKAEISQHLWDLIVKDPHVTVLNKVCQSMADKYLEETMREALIASYRDDAKLLKSGKILSITKEDGSG